MNAKITIIIHFLCIPLLWGQAYNGLTLFSPNQGGPGGTNNHSYLIDNDLNTIHSWEHQRGAASLNELKRQ